MNDYGIRQLNNSLNGKNISQYASPSRTVPLAFTQTSPLKVTPARKQQAKTPSKKNWTIRIIVVIVVILIGIGIILALYFTVFSSSSTTTTTKATPSTIPTATPMPTATSGPFPDYTGSAGVCTYDTDCPVITRREKDPALGVDSLITYTQYCVSGTCVTNKVCSNNSDCLSSNVPDQNEDCDPLNGAPCRYTSGCVNGYCQRLRCQNNVNCGLFEACTMNSLESSQYGYCLPLGNTCNNTQTFGTTTVSNGSVECWGGYFPCTGTIQGEPGYCTQCYAGSDVGGECNMTDNINTGPGSVCTIVSDFTVDPTITTSAPSSCRVVDNIKYSSCQPGYVEVESSTASVCCKANAGGMCGKVCQDDYQCDDACPFCVGGVCSCVQVSPFSLWRDNIASNIPCQEGYGFSGTSDNMQNDQNSSNEILDDVHVCVVSNALVGTQAYNHYTLNGITGNLNCSSDKPYYNIAQGKCTNTLDGAACYYDRSNAAGYCRNSDGTISSDYVCSISGTCRKGKLQAGEKCGGTAIQQCDTGLVCISYADDITNRYKRICIPDPN